MLDNIEKDLLEKVSGLKDKPKYICSLNDLISLLIFTSKANYLSRCNFFLIASIIPTCGYAL